ncbi:hypothetical protein BST95_00540 [Halioglobus japonicus]|uniref:Uncharacterized protein n=2 Tax=Halioglobus japonicus TaxID=930805 RepID=A0AAP8MBR9_9GAMM|nr:hypothetical protein BST95_00540 [Halioglobus japonicus]PLW84816.1 hypothetical protein C0029_17605 [Halioglobus japonicus]GHD21555.1 hypothetical protein GCM10007052_32480 [Halioglobus japonicus]
MFMMTSIRAVLKAGLTAAVLAAMGGCISSPLPVGSIATLYRWDDRQSAVATRTGEAHEEEGGYFSGDFDFSDVLTDYPELAERPDEPILIEACAEETCYRVVVFGNMFSLSAEGLVSGYASMNAITTAMANQVLNLPVEEVRPALDVLAGRLTASGEQNYAAFLALDPERKPKHIARLVNARLYDTAEHMMLEQPGFGVDALLGQSATETMDLVVPEGFDFDDSFKISVDVDVSSMLEEEAFLLVCAEYEESGAGYEIDFDACQLRTALIGGRYVGELNLTGTFTELLVVVLPMESPEDALYFPWSQQEDGNRLRI